MNDSPTRRSLDALADLYLTGPAPAAGARAEAVPPDRRAADAPADPAAPTPPEDGQPGPGASRPYLFLHDGPRAAADRPPPRLEALVLGHLPGYASPWISQYADEAARRHGGAALLRVGEREVSLELFDAQPPPDAEDEPTSRAAAGGPEELLDTLEALARRIGAWLVVFDQPEGAIARRRLLEFERWTLLTGADDTAVVGAYRLLKSLAGEAGADRPRQGVGLMFMGCGESVAERAADRLASAAAYVMRLTVELVGHRRRMDAVRRQQFGRFAFDRSDPWRMLNGFFGELLELGGDGRARASASLVSDEEALTAARDQPPTARPADHPDTAAQPTTGRPSPVAESPPKPRVIASIDTVKPLPVGDRQSLGGPDTAPPNDAPPDDPAPPVQPCLPAQPPAPLPPPVHARPSARPHGPGPARPPRSPSPEPPAAGLPDLTAYLTDVRPLASRCPRQPHITIGIDRAGRFHLTHRTDASSPADTTLRELLEASAWVQEHRHLLDLTRPARGDGGHRGDSPPPADPEPPMLHLFTDSPKAALELAYAGPPDRRPIRLHLLKSVPTPTGATIDVHEELN